MSAPTPKERLLEAVEQYVKSMVMMHALDGEDGNPLSRASVRENNEKWRERLKKAIAEIKFKE